MIERLAVKQCRGLRDVALNLGRCTLLIGPNGGGKSNILDAIRFLQGTGNGFTVREILDGKTDRGATAVAGGPRGRRRGPLAGCPCGRCRPGLLDVGLPRDAFAIYAALSQANNNEGYMD